MCRSISSTQGRKKKFIDKKESTIFHVVHRSQQDKANEGEEEASEFVLIPSGVSHAAFASRGGIGAFTVAQQQSRLLLVSATIDHVKTCSRTI